MVMLVHQERAQTGLVKGLDVEVHVLHAGGLGGDDDDALVAGLLADLLTGVWIVGGEAQYVDALVDQVGHDLHLLGGVGGGAALVDHIDALVGGPGFNALLHVVPPGLADDLRHVGDGRIALGERGHGQNQHQSQDCCDDFLHDDFLLGFYNNPPAPGRIIFTTGGNVKSIISNQCHDCY